MDRKRKNSQKLKVTNKNGQNRTEMDRNGQQWTETIKNGQKWTETYRNRQKRTETGKKKRAVPIILKMAHWEHFLPLYGLCYDSYRAGLFLADLGHPQISGH